LLVRQAQPVIDRRVWDWIVPVPLHPLKQREREFNQAERLAVRLAAATRMTVKLNCLRRVLPTRTQTLLNRTERTDNVRRAFATPDGLKLDGQRIVLVDDVFTTGATTSACARALKQAGASEVCVWTVARGL
jgi:competence protein ComFC